MIFWRQGLDYDTIEGQFGCHIGEDEVAIWQTQNRMGIHNRWLGLFEVTTL